MLHPKTWQVNAPAGFRSAWPVSMIPSTRWPETFDDLPTKRLIPWWERSEFDFDFLENLKNLPDIGTVTGNHEKIVMPDWPRRLWRTKGKTNHNYRRIKRMRISRSRHENRTLKYALGKKYNKCPMHSPDLYELEIADVRAVLGKCSDITKKASLCEEHDICNGFIRLMDRSRRERCIYKRDCNEACESCPEFMTEGYREV